MNLANIALFFGRFAENTLKRFPYPIIYKINRERDRKHRSLVSADGGTSPQSVVRADQLWLRLVPYCRISFSKYFYCLNFEVSRSTARLWLFTNDALMVVSLLVSPIILIA